MMSGQDVLVEVLKCMATSAARRQGHVWYRHGFDLGLGRGATHFFLSPAMPHHKSGSSGRAPDLRGLPPQYLHSRCR